jgi:hypothetical protein
MGPMGWGNKKNPKTKKDYLHLSFISFGISHSRFSDSRISFLVLGYPRDIPRYPRTKKDTLHLSFISFGISHFRFSDSGISQGYPKTSKDTLGISSSWSYPRPIPEISLRYPKTSRFILGVRIPDG